MTAKKTYYNLDDGLFIMDGLDSPSVAADRLRAAWARAANPTSDFPFRRSDLTQAFARVNSEATFKGSLASFVTDQGLAGTIPTNTEARIYSLWTCNPLDRDEPDYIEPQMDVMEKRAGETWIRNIESLSLREFVKDNIDGNDADRSLLYRIKMWTNEHEIIHGDNVEHALNLIKGRDNPKVGTLMEFTQDHIDQLERALEDHRERAENIGLTF